MAGKAFALAAAWLVLPLWAFLFLAVAAYLVPVFRPLALGGPFIVLLVLMGLAPPTVLAALYFGALFFLVLGVKDLAFVDRGAASQALSAMLVLVLAMAFFAGTACSPSGPYVYGGTWPAQHNLIERIASDSRGACPPGRTAPLVALLFVAVYVLYRSAIGAEGNGMRSDAPPVDPSTRRERNVPDGMMCLIGALIVAELGWTLALLPLTYFVRTALLFLVAAVLGDLMLMSRRSPVMPRTAILADATLVLVLGAVLLAGNQWGLG